MTAGRQTVDLGLREHHVQDLSGRDAVAGFFASLGYDTVARTRQAPANLGITAEGLANQIRHAELIANQDRALQVYLFELTSVTQAATQGLARAFRNRGGNFLLVLTTKDYDRLDFVLLERYIPQDTAKSSVAQPQAAIRPRVLSVERLKPARVDMRVLRRFTYTEADPYAQYEKLLSAYAIADWSEDSFNNRALFADYYLKERLPLEPEWQENSHSAYSAMRDLFRGARTSWANKPEDALRKGLLEPALRALGFDYVALKAAGSDDLRHDYVLRAPGSSDDLAVCLVYPWNRFLDGKDYSRDDESPEENPGALVLSLLREGGAKWAIVTNGKHWRLYSARTHSRATNYYEMDLEETLAAPDPAEVFRYFWMIFRCRAFAPRHVLVEGQERTSTFLDQLLDGSETYAKELGDKLKVRVFEKIFPHLASGFVAYRKAHEGADTDLSQEALDEIFEGTLTLLYRLLFLLYAEARDLLPVKTSPAYATASMSRLKTEVAQAAGEVGDKLEARLKKAYTTDSTTLYDRLLSLFAAVDRGNPALNMPVYNGGLFISKVDDEDESAEMRNARFLLANKVPDRFLAMALDLLARDEDAKTFKRVFVDYKSLGVRQLGSIYEGLLEFHLRLAREKMAVCKGKKTEEIVPYREAVKSKRTVLREGRGREAAERTLSRGTLYLENTRHERKATGSYYTPDYIVKYIVEHTVGPVLEEKFGAVRPKLREAQRRYQAARKRQAALPAEDAEKVAGDYRGLVDEFFDVKVLDPAMGSGHFLVEAVDFITDRMVDFLNGFPWNPVTALRGTLGETRRTVLREMEEQGISIDHNKLTDVNLLKRHVLKRCIYGVDLNPMAVELAKVSLWLDCFTLGAPLSFLDHHLKCGNSLIGAQDVEDAIVGSRRRAELLHAITNYLQIGALADATSSQVTESRRLWREAEKTLAPTKRRLNMDTARHFLDLGSDVAAARAAQCAYTLEASTAEDRKRFAAAQWESEERRFFHWQLEFPEVWYGVRPDAERVVVKRDGAGFDAVVGNPPYVQLSMDEELRRELERFLIGTYGSSMGRLNTFGFFVHLACRLTAQRRRWSMIVPNTILTMSYYAPLRRQLLQTCKLYSCLVLDRLPFEDAVVENVVLVAEPNRDTRGVANHRVVFSWAPQTHAATTPCAVLPQQWFVEAHDAVINPHLTPVKHELEIRLGTCSQLLGEAFHVNQAIALKHDRAAYLSGARQGAAWKPVLDGGDIDRFAINYPGVYLHYALQAIHSGGREEVFLAPEKLLFRRVGDRLIAAYDSDQYYALNTIVMLTPKTDCTVSLKLLLALLNSGLADWYLRTYLKSAKEVFSEIQARQMERLPVRRIHFTTPSRERAALVKDLKVLHEAQYCEEILARIDALLPKAADGAFLAFRPGATGAEEKSDVVHDFLAYLAEQMIVLNKQKQAEAKRFLDWLVRQLRISPDSKGNEGLDALTGKTRLRGYLGDYQKGEEPLSFDDLVGTLQKNRTRLGANLSDPAFLTRLRTEYEFSLAKLLPIKTSLAKTDWLIDQVVYRLYGLTEEEVRIVEGSSERVHQEA